MIAFFTRHPNAANLLLLAGVVLGLMSITSMERETFPEFSATEVSVSVIYPGASAADVDEQICQELDDALGGVDNLEDLECLSVDGRARATLEMAEGSDIGQFYNDVASISSSMNTLPDAADPPAVAIEGKTDLIALLAVSGVDTSDALVRYTDELANRIEALPLVSAAIVSGISAGELRISFDQSALRRYGLSAGDVSDAIATRSLRAPVGTVATTSREITLRYSDVRRSVRELEDLVVTQNDSGGFVRLSDLGTVTLVEEKPEVRSFIDGERAAIIQITKNRTDDAINAFAQFQTLLDDERQRYPEPFKIEVTNDITEIVSDRINLVVENTAMGLVLVIAVMMMFFSLREAIWISLALPFSFLTAMFFMSLVGVTINMISLIALLMSVGLIMDDSIVIADNIAKWRTKLPPKQAALRGVSEVFPGVLSSFLTTACVFGPLMFLSGEIGQILRFIPIVLLITLGISLLEAFLILPNHLSHVHGDPAASERRLVPRNVDRFKNAVILPIVRFLLRWRYFTVGSTFAVLIITIGMIAGGTIKIIGFPSTEGDTIEVRLSLSSGLPMQHTEATVEQLLSALERIDAKYTPATLDQQPLVERTLVRYATNQDVKDNGAHTVTISVDLLSSEQRNVAANDILIAWKQEAGPITDLVQSNFTQNELGPGGKDLEVHLSGGDLQELEAATGEMLARLLARHDVTGAYQDFYGGRPEINLSLTEYGYTIGLTPLRMVNQLRAAFSGSETDSFKVGVSGRDVQVELANSVLSLADLENFPISLPNGKQVGLDTIANVQLSTAYPQITRKNGTALARVIGTIDNDIQTATGIGKIVLSDFAPGLKQRYPGVSVSVGGASEETSKSQSSIALKLLTGLIGVYIILAFQFHSYTLPVVVMLAIPFALIGTVFGHMALGLNLSMPSMIGFASLSGVVVNNAILFLTFFETHVVNGDYKAAAADAVSHRFRPVLLSSTTTFVGLMPIIFEASPQAQTLVPLVVSVAFGLLASFVLVVFVFPSALAIYFDFKSIDRWLETRASAKEQPMVDAKGEPSSG
ncbi:MAG: efflux RND transporter permease subunit [Rhodobacteraceae bacterium]|nr:efflux RND transporter permease subunit [Paracoccaceae bacterium]